MLVKMFRKPEEAKEVLRILNKEFKYFVRLFAIARDLRASAGNPKKRKKAKADFKELGKFEDWEQLNSPVEKLKNAAGKLMSIIHPSVRRNVQTCLKQMEVFEAQTLFDTSEKLGPEIEGKKQGEIDWQKVAVITDKIIEHLQALVAVDTELREIVKKGPYAANPRQALAR